VTVLAQALAFGLQMAGTIVLARLLTPADFGVVTMATTFSLLLTNFGMNGFTEALIQRPEIDHGLVSNLFWLNTATGILLTLGFAAAGSLMARFYGDTHVAAVAAGISLSIFFTSISVQHLALLKRAMRFSLLSTNDILARLVSVLISISLAWAGWGYWALVAGVVVLPLSTGIGGWILCRWTPGFPRRHPGTGSVIRAALNIYGFFAVNYFSRNADNLLVGWRFGSVTLGFYKRAYDLFVLPANQLLFPVSAVALPTLSRLTNDREKYRHYLLRSVAILAFVGMGLGALFTLIGRDLIFVLLGPKWGESGSIFTLFGPGIGAMFISGTWSWVHISIGRADRCFRWGIIEFIVTAGLFLLALPWGARGIAFAWTASIWILSVPAFWYAGKPINIGAGPFIRSIWRYVLAAAMAGSSTVFLISTFSWLAFSPDASGAILRIVSITILLGSSYLVAVIVLHGGPEPIQLVARLMPAFLPWKRFSPSSPKVAD
jgi:O-antigen/teichoic acid export membrane protein